MHLLKQNPQKSGALFYTISSEWSCIDMSEHRALIAPQVSDMASLDVRLCKLKWPFYPPRLLALRQVCGTRGMREGELAGQKGRLLFPSSLLPSLHPSPLFYRPVPSKRLKGHPGGLLLSSVNKSGTRRERGRGFISHVYWRRLNSHRLWGCLRYRLLSLSLNVIAPCPHTLGFLLSRSALRTADWPTVWCHTSSDSRAAW